jgi:Transcriptional regulator
MQMHQIRYFLALCEERNFTRAAKRSGVSQPSLTNGIITLERELRRSAVSTQADDRAHCARLCDATLPGPDRGKR